MRGGAWGAPKGAGDASTGGAAPPWAKDAVGRPKARTPEAAMAKPETSEALRARDLTIHRTVTVWRDSGRQENSPPMILNTRSCCRSFQVANNINPSSNASPTR